MQRFQNKVVLVTGGASGIGAACVRRFAEEGAHVWIADIAATAAEQMAAQIRTDGGKASFVEVDLAQPQSIQAAAEEVGRALSALHVVVNNAGIVKRSSIEQTGEADWEPQVAINLRAPALLVRALLPLLRQEGGAIVNVSSEGGFRPRADHWVYDATKAGICALTRTMAVEFWPYGIRANAVAPGWTVTEMHFGQAADTQARKQQLEAHETSGCIMRRLGRPHEIAAAIAFLASSDAAYITGTTLHVDGGMGLG